MEENNIVGKEILDEIIKIKQNIDKFLDSHSDEGALVDEITKLCAEHDFKSEKYIEDYFYDKVDPDRTLRVGIVGRVKAGKSSLINSLLFDGKDILPKASTPMTAALTNIKYSNKNYIEVEFITTEDIDDLKKVYDRYKEKYNEILNEKIKREEEKKTDNSIQTKIMKKISEYTSSEKNKENNNYDLEELKKEAAKEVDKNEYLKGGKERYLEITNADKSIYVEAVTEKTKNIDFENIEEISDKLKDYVGSKGNYVNFVKSLNIYINEESLKDLDILDTPGFNDPVESRERKARELLSKCDVVLILMPSIQAFDKNDENIIKKIRKKEGIREIYVIISQFDTVLITEENKKAAGGDLWKAKDIILKKLKDYIKETFDNMNDENIFDDLIDNIDDRVIYSSGICYSILKDWDNNKENIVIKNLREYYPDYISLDEGERDMTLETLKDLANIEAIQEILKKVTAKKEEILGENLEIFKTKFTEEANYIKRKLKLYCNERLQNIKFGDIEKTQKKLKNLEAEYNVISLKLDVNFKDTIDDWYIAALKDITKKLDEYFEKAKGIIDEDAQTKTKGEETVILFIKKDVPVDAIDTQKVKDGINDYVTKFNQQLLGIFFKERYQSFREKLISNAIKVFEDIEDEDMNKETLASIIRPEIEKHEEEIGKYKYKNKEELRNYEGKRKLSDGEKDRFEAKAKKILETMRKDFYKIVKEDNLDKFKDNISKIELADKVLKNYVTRITNFRDELKNKEQSTYKWEKRKEEVNKLI